MSALVFSFLLLVTGPADTVSSHTAGVGVELNRADDIYIYRLPTSGQGQSAIRPEASGQSVLADSLPYDLQNPVVAINFPSEDLLEISALGPTDEPGIFCAISDEKGEILFIDGNNGGAIVRRAFFRDKGDFEGVEKVGKCLYALKSNGDLYEIENWDKKRPRSRQYSTSISKTDDAEGLCYDIRRQALLIACKGNPDSAYRRDVYAFDLQAKQLGQTPVFSVDPVEVNRLVPHATDEKHGYFSPSGIAIHPLTGDVYIISTALKRLVVLDYQSGAIRFAVRLNKKLLPQPEGIAFDPEGNLYLSSEGKKGGEGLFFRFDYKKQ